MDAPTAAGQKTKKTKKKVQRLDESLFNNAIITRQITLPMVNVGKNLMKTFESFIQSHYEGKCSVEGYVKEGSTRVLSYSAGRVYGDMINFQVVVNCDLCSPVEGMNIQCRVTNITKAGIRAESKESPSPIVVFIARDQFYDMDEFNDIKEGDVITVTVIGKRFELNERYISIIAELKKKK
tara:strand:- start:4601 stop:5143 length:543 start_codon:yes stop_codon:yes gene_type:complete